MDEVILINYLRRKSSPEEDEQVEQWYSRSAENRQLLEQYYYTLFVGNRMEAMKRADTEKALRQLKQRIAGKESGKKAETLSLRLRRHWTWVAAFLAGLIFSGGAGWLWLSGQTADYTVLTAAGQRAQTILPDGSKVWLNGTTRLVYHRSFGNSSRQVDLTGEAYFEVKPDRKAPFVVNSKNIKTCVLGTHFNIRAREGESRVVTTLLEGAVRVDLPCHKEQNGYILKPGQTLDIDTQNYRAQLVEYGRPSDVLLWIDGVLTFKQHTLQQITGILEKMYDVKFVYEDSSLKEKRFTGKFSTDSTPEEILNVLLHTNHFKYAKQGHIIRLSSK